MIDLGRVWDNAVVSQWRTREGGIVYYTVCIGVTRDRREGLRLTGAIGLVDGRGEAKGVASVRTSATGGLEGGLVV